MDMEFFGKALDAVGLPVIVLDDVAATKSAIKRLHPTLKKCHCGFIGSKHLFMRHMDVLLAAARSGGEEPEVFWQKHGEVPLNEDEV